MKREEEEEEESNLAAVDGRCEIGLVSPASPDPRAPILSALTACARQHDCCCAVTVPCNSTLGLCFPIVLVLLVNNYMLVHKLHRSLYIARRRRASPRQNWHTGTK